MGVGVGVSVCVGWVEVCVCVWVGGWACVCGGVACGKLAHTISFGAHRLVLEAAESRLRPGLTTAPLPPSRP